MTTSPPRPRSMDPHELGFTPRKRVPWLAPFLLLSTGIRTLGAVLFGAYLDKRELQDALPGDLHCEQGDEGGLWLDYVADLGDGFDATYSVAYLLAQPQLSPGGRPLPRGRVLLMGGDQVYPTASGDEYENRMKGPYRAALPEPPADGPQPTLFALPGNHDWYDGLTAFLRLFARRKDASIGGWRTAQRRSYFAVELPGNWWVFGIDEQSGAYIDDPQLVYFERAASRLSPGDRVIVMTPEPTWVKARTQPDAYDAVDYFVRTIVAPTGAEVRVMVSGDLHHYARYSSGERELITCGGGGAFLLGTQDLPERITVPPPDTLTRHTTPRHEYAKVGAYPDTAASRRYAWGVFGRLPVRNPGFGTMLGIVHTLLMLAMLGATTRVAGEQRLVTIPLIALLLITVAGAVLFAQPPGAAPDRRVRHWALGGLHGLAHVGLAAAGTWVWLQFPFRDWPWPWPLAVAAVLYAPVIGYLASLLVSLYLLVASWFGVNVNELFAGQGIEHGKSFLRLHVAPDGTLTIYPIGVDRICKKWEAAPDAPADAPWLRPTQPLPTHLIEEPIVIAPAAVPRQHAAAADPGQPIEGGAAAGAGLG